jgi:ATP-dependent protease Clp ATPase subunit
MQKRTFFGVLASLGRGGLSPTEDVESTCSFCGRADHQVMLVSSGSESQVSICEKCISICLTHIRQGDRESFDRIVAATSADTRTVAVLAPSTWRQQVRCSFCDSMRNGRVIAGPQVFICYECVGLGLHDIRNRDRELFDRLITGV